MFRLQISGPAVQQFCQEASSYLRDERYPDLVNLLLTSADLVLANTSEKGASHECLSNGRYLQQSR